MSFFRLLIRKKTFLTIIILLISGFICFFGVRGIILQKAITIIDGKLLDHQYFAHWDEVRFKGIKTIFIKGIHIESGSGDKEIDIDSVLVKIRVLPLMIKRLRIKKLDCRAVLIRYNDFDSLKQNVNSGAKDSINLFSKLSEIDLAGIAYKNIRRFFHYIPAKISFGIIEAKSSYAGNPTIISLNNFTLFQGQLFGFVNLTGNDSSVVIPLKGSLNKDNSIIELSLVTPDSVAFPLSILKDKYGITAGFDSLSFLFNMAQKSRNEVNIDGFINFTGFQLNGESLSAESIFINQFKSSFKIIIGHHQIEIDSSSVTYLNNIRLNPYVRLSVNKDPVIDFKLRPVTWPADDFFSSLPHGMFTSLTAIKTEGSLHYFLNLSVNLNNPDSLIFDTRLSGEDFKILEYGTDDYRILNDNFVYKAYERGQLAASFVVGPSNPDFVLFENISPFVRAAVMTSEDGSFFYHHGFNPGAFKESIATNIKEKRFARGGSTITMQLVKNAFLTRNKTIARKIEEALIVWIIENKKLVSKQRMYEVYLNIIEWGPGIYGIRQASKFYFDKEPNHLNLGESIFLASIVPHPKWYKYSFISNGILKPFYGNYFDRLTELMVRKEFISPSDTVSVKPGIRLTGPGSSVFENPDLFRMDSLYMEELDFIPVSNISD